MHTRDARFLSLILRCYTLERHLCHSMAKQDKQKYAALLFRPSDRWFCREFLTKNINGASRREVGCGDPEHGSAHPFIQFLAYGILSNPVNREKFIGAHLIER